MFKQMNKGHFRAFGKPVVNIYINDKKLDDWISFNVEQNGLGDIDTFEIELQWDISNEPRNDMFYSGANSSSFIVKERAVIKIDIGFEGEQIKTLIEGEMDYPEWDFSDKEIVKLVGRSYASRPYDFVTTKKYQNMTSTEVHKKICEIHGLTPVVPVATNTLIGEYVNNDHSTVAEEMSHWDYILFLAEQEGFVSRVQGKNWYFGPLQMIDEYKKEPLPFSYGHNIRNLKMKRAPNTSRNLKVEVISWQPGNKKSKGSRIIEKGSIGDTSGDNVYTIRRNIPNITRKQAQQQVKNLCDYLTQQQFSGSFDTDFYPDIANDRRIVLYGVGITLSQVYHVQKISILGSKSGIECTIDFINVIES